MKGFAFVLTCALGLVLSLAGCERILPRPDDTSRGSATADDVEPAAPSTPATYYDGDETVLSGTLHTETYEYKGYETSVFILVLDEPIDCYVASYRDFYANDNQPTWHYGVTNVELLFDYSVNDPSAYVGSHVTVRGTLRGGGKWSACYDESGTFQPAAGDAFLNDVTLE